MVATKHDAVLDVCQERQKTIEEKLKGMAEEIKILRTRLPNWASLIMSLLTFAIGVLLKMAL